MDLQAIFEKAKTSPRWLKMLNLGLARMIPFNKPHKYKVIHISDTEIKVKLPYIRKNFNHIKGLHACSLATVSEFCTGLMLISRLEASQYRLIMQRMEMDYHYQGKMDAIASFSLTDEVINEQVKKPLENSDSTILDCEVHIHDTEGNHLTTGHIFWQVKDWAKVKTKVA
ncbi:MAG TPA: DUF4442 domain-containing protein [Cytophagales bacterium]|nr:DUF4442 domain-containing protein [Cytophagales bacterium]HAP62614.1 DUF4442 domain-containing protein [Cytophagales bacterium]